jgi:hypothetical protein
MEMINIIPTSEEAALLKKLQNRFDRDGAPAQIQRSFLRVEKPLTSENVAETFNLTDGSRVKRSRERYIGKNDLVVLFEMKIFLNKCGNETANNANSIDYTYPDLVAFPDAGEALALEAIYNGVIGLKSDTYEALNAYSNTENRVVPRTQLETGILQASFSGAESGFVKLTQPQVFSGQSAIELSFLPASNADLAAIGGGVGTSNVMGIQFKTFVVRNGAQSLTRDNYGAALKDSIMKFGRL